MLTEPEKEEFKELQKYIKLCSLGDRPQSPAALKLKRYTELKNKYHANRSTNKKISG